MKSHRTRLYGRLITAILLVSHHKIVHMGGDLVQKQSVHPHDAQGPFIHHIPPPSEILSHPPSFTCSLPLPYSTATHRGIMYRAGRRGLNRCSRRFLMDASMSEYVPHATLPHVTQKHTHWCDSLRRVRVCAEWDKRYKRREHAHNTQEDGGWGCKRVHIPLNRKSYSSSPGMVSTISYVPVCLLALACSPHTHAHTHTHPSLVGVNCVSIHLPIPTWPCARLQAWLCLLTLEP